MDKQIQQAIENTSHYLAKIVRGWINGDASVSIPDPEFDLIRKWIELAKAPRSTPVIADSSDAQKFRNCLIEILQDTKSRTTRDQIMSVLAKPGELPLE